MSNNVIKTIKTVTTKSTSEKTEAFHLRQLRKFQIASNRLTPGIHEAKRQMAQCGANEFQTVLKINTGAVSLQSRVTKMRFLNNQEPHFII